MFCQNTGDDHDESAGGAADLHLGAAQQGNQKAAHNGGVDAGLRCHAGGDPEGHCHRQSHSSDRQSGDQVGDKVFTGITS